MPNLQIRTTQNVLLNYSLAGIGERILAFLIDGFILFLYALLIDQLAKVVGWISEDGWTQWGFSSLLFLPAACYSLLMHSLFNGQTIGKMILKIRVVRRDGDPVTWSNYLVRWLLRILDIWLFFGSIGLLAIIFSDTLQRVGDAAAGTVVVNNKRKVKVSHTILEEVAADYTPVFTNVTILTDRDVRLIKDTYHVARRTNDHKTLRALRERVETILDSQSDLYDKPYLDTVLKDYSYYTGR